MTSDPTQGYSANDYNILVQAQESKQDASIVLSLLNIAIHSYTEFIINMVLVRKLDTIENILTELKSANNLDILNLIDVVRYKTQDNFPEIEVDLIQKGIKHLNAFLIFKADLIDYEDFI
jgi:hypothetical protein